MRKTTLTLASLLATSLLIAQPSALLAQMGGMGGGDMGGGMGGMGGGGGPGGGGGGPGGPGDGASRPSKPKMPKPIKRKTFDKVVTAMFETADANHDGTVTLEELHAVIDARRAAIIRERFASVDTNRDKTISEAEFIAWQSAMGSAAAHEDSALGRSEGPIPDAITPDAGKDDEDLMLDDLIEPLTGTVIAKANTNYDAGLSLDEFLAYEGKIFEAADKDGDGELSMMELRPHGHGGAGGPGGPGGRGGPPPGGFGPPPQEQ